MCLTQLKNLKYIWKTLVLRTQNFRTTKCNDRKSEKLTWIAYNGDAMIWSRNINNLKPIGAPCQRLSPYQDWRKVFWQYICPTKGLLLCSIANRNMGYFIWSEYRKYLVTPDFMFRSSCTSFVSLHWFKSSADSSLHCVTISSYSKRYSGTLSPYALANWASSKDL